MNKIWKHLIIIGAVVAVSFFVLLNPFGGYSTTMDVAGPLLFYYIILPMVAVYAIIMVLKGLKKRSVHAKKKGQVTGHKVDVVLLFVLVLAVLAMIFVLSF